MTRKRKKKRFRKVIFILIILGIIFGVYIFLNKKSFLNKINYSIKGKITYYDIYGIHMNFEGDFNLKKGYSNPKLVLTDGLKERVIPWKLENEGNDYTFKTSDYINDGINLESLENGTYYFLIKVKSDDKDVYFPLINDTDYEDLTYYTLTKKGSNKVININWDKYQGNEFLGFYIKNTDLPADVYDITIDPGHDVNDAGMIACLDGSVPNSLGGCSGSKAYKESDLNFNVSKELKEELEKLGYKVKLTRGKNDSLPTYGHMGSGTTANTTKSKLNIALHHNSTNFPGGMASTHGLEVYVASNSKLDLARLLVKNICEYAQTDTSTKKEFKVENGIYKRLSDDGTPYYYMIREVGGIATGAYVDGSNTKYDENPYYNSNNTAEGYLLELGYIDNVKELKNIINNSKGYARGIAKAIDEYLKEK